MRSFTDFSNELLALKETLKVKKEIANVAGDGDEVKRNLRSGQSILIWKMKAIEQYTLGQ